MTAIFGPELILIRHAPADVEGRLCGRTDVPVRVDCLADLARLRDALGGARRRVASPALRCRQTVAALWPEGPPAETDARLTEQDFGDWDGLALVDVPDLGPLAAEALATHRPPGGESFADLCARVGPALSALADRGGVVAVVAHAGTVRAALALAVGPAPALAFQVTPLSVTRLRRVPGGFAVTCANCLPG